MLIIIGVATLCFKTAHPERSTRVESGIEGVKSIDDLPWEYENLSFTGHGNVKIKGWVVKADSASTLTPSAQSSSPNSSKVSEKTFILIHGHKKNKIQMLGRGRLLHSLGYNLLFIDFRHHGESDDGPFGLGYFGRFDLQLLINEVRTKIFPGSWTGVFGVSLGATTAIATEAEFGSIDCIIADSPSSNQTTTLCEYGSRIYHAPFLLTKSALKLVEIYYGMDFKKLNIPKMIEEPNNQTVRQNGEATVEQNGDTTAKQNNDTTVEQNGGQTIEGKGWKNIPVLLLHGKKDNRVPFYHSQKLYDVIKSVSRGETIRLIEFTTANHVEGYSLEREVYDNEVRDFLTHCACCQDA